MKRADSFQWKSSFHLNPLPILPSGFLSISAVFLWICWCEMSKIQSITCRGNVAVSYLFLTGDFDLQKVKESTYFFSWSVWRASKDWAEVYRGFAPLVHLHAGEEDCLCQMARPTEHTDEQKPSVSNAAATVMASTYASTILCVYVGERLSQPGCGYVSALCVRVNVDLVKCMWGYVFRMVCLSKCAWVVPSS